MRKILEKHIESGILDYLNFAQKFVCYKNINIGVFDKTVGAYRKARNKYAPVGVSDIYGNYSGRALFIEVKTEDEYAYLMKHYFEIRSYMGVNKKKNHLKNQIKFIEDNKCNGAIAFFTYSIKDTKTKLFSFGVPAADLPTFFGE